MGRRDLAEPGSAALRDVRGEGAMTIADRVKFVVSEELGITDVSSGAVLATDLDADSADRISLTMVCTTRRFVCELLGRLRSSRSIWQMTSTLDTLH